MYPSFQKNRRTTVKLRLFGLVAWPLLFSFLVLPLVVFSQEEKLLSRIQSHLTIHDPRSAATEIAEAAPFYPHSLPLLEKEIEVHAILGNEKKMLGCWNLYQEKNPEAFSNSDLLEKIAWGVIDKGFQTATPISRAIALIAAKLSDCAKGVRVLDKGMQDPNGLVRALAAELSTQFLDEKLQARIVTLIEEETFWQAKLAAIKAAGDMRIKFAEIPLRTIIEDDRRTAEEKALAVQSLVKIMDRPTRQDLTLLASSKREGLRLLACEIILQYEDRSSLDILVPLLHDHSADIRKAVLQVYGVLREPYIAGKSTKEMIVPLLKDKIPKVSMIAAWALILLEHPAGQHTLYGWVNDDLEENRAFAAGCIRATGKYGVALIERAFVSTRDPYVKMNLALALIGERKYLEPAAEAIYNGLVSHKQRLMWQEEGIFQILTKSKVRYRADMPQYPEVVNKLVRLELLQILAFINYPKAPLIMKQFLKEKAIGLTGMAIALMLTEGEEESLDLVRPLLQDPDSFVRAQAALILALWGREEEVIHLLEVVYAEGNRSIKEKVLEGLGHIGANSSLPFLLERLSEPQQHLRMIAASAIIQCLNH